MLSKADIHALTIKPWNPQS